MQHITPKLVEAITSDRQRTAERWRQSRTHHETPPAAPAGTTTGRFRWAWRRIGFARS